MAKKEVTPLGNEGGSERGGSGPNKTKKDEYSPSNLLGDLVTIFKLRFLQRKSGLGEIGAEKLKELEVNLNRGNKEEKSGAEGEVKHLFQQAIREETVIDNEVGLKEAMELSGETNRRVLEKAESIDQQLTNLETINQKMEPKNFENLEIELRNLAEETGVNIGEKGVDIKRVVNEEIGRIQELQDRLKIVQHREDLREIVKDIGGSNIEKIKQELLTEEDFKEKSERGEEKRIFKVKKGANRIRQQREIDELVEVIRTDLSSKNLSRMDEKDLMKKFLQTKKLAVQRYGGVEERDRAYDLGMKISFVYGEEIVNRAANRIVRKFSGKQAEMVERFVRDEAFLAMQEVWVKANNKMNPEEVESLINERLSFIKERNSDLGEKAGLGRNSEKQVLDDLLGSSMGRRRGGEELGEWTKDFEERNVGASDLFSLMDDVQRSHPEDIERRRSEFVRLIAERFGFETVKGEQIYDALRSSRGREHYTILQEKLKNEDYAGYTRELMGYLFNVGLREGQRDIYLSSLMTEAKAILSKIEDKSYKTLFDNFEKIMIFADNFSSLGGMEEYARLAKLVGVEHFQSFMEKYSEALSVNVEVGGNEKKLSAWKFHDMLQEEGWATKIHYREGLTLEDVYRDMVVSLVKGETCRVEGERILNMKGEDRGLLSDVVVIKEKDKEGGKEVRLDSFVAGNLWMTGVAHNTWRASGRWANVLDNVSVARSVENKDLLGVYKIRRYCEEYGIVDTSLLEALGVDGLIYSFENYKGLVGKGIEKLLEEAGVERDLAKSTGKLIEGQIKNIRAIRDEKFKTNYMSVDDVRLLGKTKFGFDEAKEEFLRRQREKGVIIDGSKIIEKGKGPYNEKIEIMQKRFDKQKFSKEQRAQLENNVNWVAVNKLLGERLGIEMGGEFKDFMENFSYAKLTTYSKLRGSDMVDFGTYVSRAEKVIGIFKSGFKGGATQAMVEAFGAMTSYIPFHSSGYDRFALKVMEVVYDLRRRRTGYFEQPAVKVSDDGKSDFNLDGETLPNDELLVDENGYWVPKGVDKTWLTNNSILEKNTFIKSLGMADVEYAMRYAVAQGVVTRGDMEEFLKKRYGNKVSRWMRRNWWINDPWYIYDAILEEGGKTFSAVLKQIFS